MLFMIVKKTQKQPKYPTVVKQMRVKFIKWTIDKSDMDLLTQKFVCVTILL